MSQGFRPRAHSICSLIAIAAACLTTLDAHAQSPIHGPMRILYGFSGGSGDVVTRLIADRLRDSLHQPVIVEEKSGASGRVAAEALKNATPDGTTLGLLPIVVPVLAPLVFKQLNYDPARDFAPISQIATYPLAFAVTPSHPARTVPEFVAWAKSHPRQANYGTGAAGSLPHFLGAMIARETGIEMVHIGYKGAAPMTADLMSGEIPAGISVVSDLIELHRAGRIRILATSGAKRSSQLPAVPTFREQGFPAIEAHGWVGMYAPSKTPRAVIDRLSALIISAMQTAEIRQKLLDMGLEPTGTTPDELAAIVAADMARWTPIIRATGFSAD